MHKKHDGMSKGHWISRGRFLTMAALFLPLAYLSV